MLASSWASLAHFRAMLGHLGAKMANKTGKIATKSAKMRQDRPTWAAEANERRSLMVAGSAAGSALRAQRPP